MKKPNFALAAITALTIALIATPAAAQSGRVTGAYVGCVTKDALNEFTQAAISGDNRHMQSLIGVTCAPVKGYEYSIVKRGFLKSQLRVYTPNGDVVLWVPSEAASR